MELAVGSMSQSDPHGYATTRKAAMAAFASVGGGSEEDKPGGGAVHCAWVPSMLRLAMVAFVCIEGPLAVLGPKNSSLGTEIKLT